MVQVIIQMAIADTLYGEMEQYINNQVLVLVQLEFRLLSLIKKLNYKIDDFAIPLHWEISANMRQQ